MAKSREWSAEEYVSVRAAAAGKAKAVCFVQAYAVWQSVRLYTAEVRLQETSIVSSGTVDMQRRLDLGTLALAAVGKEPDHIAVGKGTAGSSHLLAAEQQDMQRQEAQSGRIPSQWIEASMSSGQYQLT